MCVPRGEWLRCLPPCKTGGSLNVPQREGWRSSPCGAWWPVHESKRWTRVPGGEDAGLSGSVTKRVTAQLWYECVWCEYTHGVYASMCPCPRALERGWTRTHTPPHHSHGWVQSGVGRGVSVFVCRLPVDFPVNNRLLFLCN